MAEAGEEPGGGPGSGARVGIDVGGTFTDAVLVDAAGRLHISKVASTPADMSSGFLAGLSVLRDRSGSTDSEIGYLAHGTTVATNALVQNRLARVGLVTNRGFKDILEIGTQQRRRIYDLWTPEPARLVSRDCCVEVNGRISANGVETQPLDEADVLQAAQRLRGLQVEAIAVVLLFSFLDPSHERRVAEVLAQELPGIPVTLSSEVAPEIREALRANTTVLNASLLPLVGRYVRRLAAEVVEEGVRAPLHLMRSNGGLAAARTAADLPVSLVTSGPAAGVVGAARLAVLTGRTELLTVDMGGTTADVAVVTGGTPQVRWAGEQSGHRVNLPQVDVLCVGAGGGSIAEVDAFGALHVGPASAGAVPGPAAYGRGGMAATVTDAHVVLGTLADGRTLGGELHLNREAAVAAVRKGVAEPLGLSEEAAAAGIIRMADANIASALRMVSVARGIDPRQMTLVVLGGAGPMHGCSLAEELEMSEVLVPPYPGVTAAMGLLLTEIRHDLGRSWVSGTSDLDVADLQAQVNGLWDRAHVLLAESGHAESGTLKFAIDLRYTGQAYSLTVDLAVDDSGELESDFLPRAEAAFVSAHEAAYDYILPDRSMELVALRITATGPTEAIEIEEYEVTNERLVPQHRQVWLNGSWCEAVVIERSAVGDAPVLGPAIIEQEDSTTVIWPQWQAVRVAAGSLLLTRRAI